MYDSFVCVKVNFHQVATEVVFLGLYDYDQSIPSNEFESTYGWKYSYSLILLKHTIVYSQIDQ